jgi:hypothetical protein
MKTHRIPSTQEVREGLEALSPLEVRLLSKKSGIPHMTLRNIRSGASENPGIETVRKFSGHLSRMLKSRPPVVSAAAPAAEGGAE